MASPGFNATQQAMRLAWTELEQCEVNAGQTMNYMSESLRSILSQYSGYQQVAFWGLQNRLEADMQKARQELRNISDLVMSSYRNYDMGDGMVGDLLQTLSRQADGNSAIAARLAGGPGHVA